MIKWWIQSIFIIIFYSVHTKVYKVTPPTWVAITAASVMRVTYGEMETSSFIHPTVEPSKIITIPSRIVFTRLLTCVSIFLLKYWINVFNFGAKILSKWIFLAATLAITMFSWHVNFYVFSNCEHYKKIIGNFFIQLVWLFRSNVWILLIAM